MGIKIKIIVLPLYVRMAFWNDKLQNRTFIDLPSAYVLSYFD